MIADNEKKKEYLETVKWIRLRKKDTQNRIRQLKIDWQCPGSMSQDEARSGSSIRDTSNYTVALEALENELEQIETELHQAEAKILHEINKLPHKYALVLEKRYIDRKSFSVIGKEIGYEKSNVYDLHSKALDIFKIPEE